jgi:hypothetical protein
VGTGPRSGDTWSSPVPQLSSTISASGPQTTFQPSAAGNFRLTAYVDLNGNGVFDAGEQLQVLIFAVVQATLQPAPYSAFLTRSNGFLGTGLSGVKTAPNASTLTAPMVLGAVYLLEGGGGSQMAGGPARTIGTAAIMIGDVGNLISDGFTISYPVPSPVPPAPGNVAGSGAEAPGGQLPMLDTLNVTPQNYTQNNGSTTPFRASVSPYTGPMPTLPQTGGVMVGFISSDAPQWQWSLFDQSTGNAWGSTSGSTVWQEFVVAFSQTFPATYLPLNQASWTVTPAGINDSGWECMNCTVTGGAGGIALQGIGSSAVQLWGPSYATSNQIVYH